MNKDSQIISKYIENNYIKNNCQYWNHIETEDQIYIKDKFKHIENIKLSECLYMILHHLSNRPLCPICHKEIKLERFSLGYKTFCSNNCKYSDKGKQITLEKQKNTCLKKYGVDNPMKDFSIKEKSISNCKLTNQKNYNVDYNLQRKEIRDKIRNTIKNKTGYEYAFLNKDKVLNTSDEYPFNCDFYIEDKNTYIEINASWTHGKHPFNEDNLNDVKLFNKWMNKSDYYKNAAYNWRYRDVNKRNIAINNKLNYYEIFPININDMKIKLEKIIRKIDNF